MKRLRLSPLTDAALVAAAVVMADFNQRYELLTAVGQRLCPDSYPSAQDVPPYIEGAYLIEVPA